MYGIKTVDPEFYGNGCFPSLETLNFEDIGEWEEWISHGTGQKLKRFLTCNNFQSLVVPNCCKFEIKGCKQVQLRTDIDLCSLNPIIFADFQGKFFLIKRAMQRLSEEEVEIVGYQAPTSFWHSGIISPQDANKLWPLLDGYFGYHRFVSLLKEKEEDLQLQGFPCICQYLVLESVCLAKLPQALHNLLRTGFLRRICISYCSELVSFSEATLPSQLKAIDIESCNEPECLPDTWMDSTSLECLSVSMCKSLMYLTRKQLSQNLKELVIKGCNNLKTLMHEENNTLQSSKSGYLLKAQKVLPATLEHIEIKDCNNLAYLSSSGYLPKALKYLLHRRCSRLESISERFYNDTCLKETCIEDCENLKLLPEDLQKLNHLERISVDACQSLVCFPRGGLPSANLKELVIRDCEKLEDLPDNKHQLNHLQAIEISYCSSLVSFPAGGFPSTNLKELQIRDCEKLEALPNGMHLLNQLQKIKISNCSRLVSFPEGGLPSTNLTELCIDSREKLKGLPNRMHNLISLRELWISKCRGMESFPENGFPINFTLLSIIDRPKICKPMFQWGLHRLSSLGKLHIEGSPDVVCFPPEERGIMLPTSLTILDIRKFVYYFVYETDENK
ncbi:hypothetical protein JRO89_XS02G0282700 [Xanthoceras sorbifolium]|uniref:Uncharacterized protein n=1 Tax=Xanthoceras sorbifolium TaxID=99658 RepID=A0ABQ8II13_9ROSI|nr:hypothetical protein JRO89_XS02G0282700 [Xanthoceras sorbifolium]